MILLRTAQRSDETDYRQEEIRMEKHRKIGLVVEGGGMKCAYNAGILDAFLDQGITFDYCIGVSRRIGEM